MALASYDLESWTVDLTLYPTPPIVCCTYQVDGEAARIELGPHAAVIAFCRLLKQGHDIVGANFTFDLGCLVAAEPKILPKIFEALEAGKLHDVQLLERLHDIARGTLDRDPITGGRFTYSLAALEERYFNRDRSAEKAEGSWRTRYHELDGVPLEKWPPEAIDYPLDDARGTLDLGKLMLGEGRYNVQCEAREMCAAWALKMMSLRGIRTDPAMVKKVAAEIEREHAISRQKFFKAGFVEKRKPRGGKNPETPDGYDLVERAPPKSPAYFEAQLVGPERVPFMWVSKKAPVQAAVALAYDGNPPLTPKGGISTDYDTLSESGDELLEALAASGENEKLRSSFVPVIQAGTVRPIHVSYNSILKSQRCSCRNPNLQQLPREGPCRACFTAREGFLFCSTDFGTLELCTLGQVCFELFGHSALRDALNAGQDLHTRLAARALGIDYEDALARRKAGDKTVKALRQAMKIPNFGFGGLLGAPSLVLQGRGAGVRFCESAGELERCGSMGKVHRYADRQITPTCAVCLDLAKQYKRLYFEEWPEVAEYHKMTTEIADGGEPLESMAEGKMLRLESGAGAVANHFFQNRAAVLAKDATYQVTKAFYSPGSVLYGNGAAVLMIHDEVISEVREDLAHECAIEQSRIMEGVAKRHVPDVLIKAPPALMRRWHKNAEAVYENGRLVPWEPEGN